MQTVIEQAKKSKDSAKTLRMATTAQKNAFLIELALLLENNEFKILAENQKDLADNPNITSAMRKRLALSDVYLKNIAKGVRELAAFPDPVGIIAKETIRKDGLKIRKVRTPIGVIACIFESRPNVIVDVAALCVKSGNAVIIRGGKEASNSNNILCSLICQALEKAGLPKDSVQQLEDRRYEAIYELVELDQYLDLVIPRGRAELIEAVSKHSRVPVIKHMRGLCHCYIDGDANIQKAIAIAVNAKTSNPATCNSVETIIVHSKVSDKVMPELLKQLFEKNVEVRGDARTCSYDARCKEAQESDWSEEYLDLIVSIKIVDSYEEAIAHIEKYSSGLTDSIITENRDTAERFEQEVDSASVLVNASNRLTDGEQFGLGGEIGISTARIHMRGPMGLEDLTVTKYIVEGDGHIR